MSKTYPHHSKRIPRSKQIKMRRIRNNMRFEEALAMRDVLEQEHDNVQNQRQVRLQHFQSPTNG